eukprot:CAMPEP_0179327430 /NCGR_PEP_ID=MMETSP0797-20121207/61954_1 /TAXON_ID=47934 /ORGANISM="Dinophysis acuminata, Strain DAEP01" /LENGTH=34 /DNA_ID= /DNA_START= /DNA_END= /DNA_ORIENTATION=
MPPRKAAPTRSSGSCGMRRCEQAPAAAGAAAGRL